MRADHVCVKPVLPSRFRVHVQRCSEVIEVRVAAALGQCVVVIGSKGFHDCIREESFAKTGFEKSPPLSGTPYEKGRYLWRRIAGIAENPADRDS